MMKYDASNNPNERIPPIKSIKTKSLSFIDHPPSRESYIYYTLSYSFCKDCV